MALLLHLNQSPVKQTNKLKLLWGGQPVNRSSDRRLPCCNYRKVTDRETDRHTMAGDSRRVSLYVVTQMAIRQQALL